MHTASQAAPAPIAQASGGLAIVGGLSIRKWCDAYGIHPATFYRWQHQGIAPEVLEVGGRRIVTLEADAEWRNRSKTKAT